jgi:hypothetical protein
MASRCSPTLRNIDSGRKVEGVASVVKSSIGLVFPGNWGGSACLWVEVAGDQVSVPHIDQPGLHR